MRKLLLTAITLLLLPSFSYAQADSPQLTGSVAYRERIALPPDAVIDVQLVDASVADIAAQTVAEVLINAEGRQVPVPFTLDYDAAKIVPGNRYSLRATIRSGDGMLMFSTTQSYPVLTHGGPSKVNLVLHTVGRGAHPAAAKKEATPSTSAVAEPAQPVETPQTASKVEPATTQNTPALPAQALDAPAAEQPSAQPQPSLPTPDESTNARAVTPTPAPESEPTRAEAAPSASTTPAESSLPDTSTTAQVVNSASQNATTAPETPKQTPSSAQQQQSSPTAAPEPDSSSRDTKPVEAQPATTEPTAPAPESKAVEPEAPLPDSPSTTKQAELAANAPAEPDDAAPDSMPAPPAANKALTPLADTQWKLIQLAGLPVVIAASQKPVTLAFSPEGRRIAGSAGCNSYLGTFNDDHGHLQMRPGTMTMMACVDPAGSREKKFIAMLREADGYRISGDFLLLTSNGKTVAKFRNNQE